MDFPTLQMAKDYTDKSLEGAGALKGDPGEPGKDGKAATIQIGEVTTGSAPSVINSGTETDAVFDFVLPAGGSGGGTALNMPAVTLRADGWADGSQTVDVVGVLADESKQLIIPAPARASKAAYDAAGIKYYVPEDGKVTFTAETAPAEDLTVYVAIFEAGTGSSGGGTVVLQGLKITTPPDKTSYSPGDTFDPAGMVVTATYGSGLFKPITEYTISPNGPLEAGTEKVTLSYTENGVTVTAEQPISIITAQIYGVCWDSSSASTALLRLTANNDPNNLVNTNITEAPAPAVGAGDGSSPFDSLMPWAGMEEYNIIDNVVSYKQGDSGFSRTSYDTMVFIPEYWFKIVESDSKRYFYVSSNAAAGFTKHPGSGTYVGRYNTISGNYSKSGAAPLVNITRAAARSGAKGKGAKWSEYDYASWCAVWLLYLVEFADWDSQSKIGRGYVDGNSAAINSGGTDSMAYHTGRAAGTDGKTAVQYRHIENPWGNVLEWIDGINFNERAVYICLDPANYADDTNTNYAAAGVTLPTNGWMTQLGESSNFPWAFLPTGVGGSETSSIPDYLYSNTGWRVLMVGSRWDRASTAGLFYFDANLTSSYLYFDIGTRLLCNP